MNLFKIFGGALLSAALVACGGGGGSPGSIGTGGGGSNPDTTTTVAVADLVVAVDKATLTNTGSDLATVEVTAVDASRNVVAGAPVTVSVDAASNGIFTPASAGGVTSEAGLFSGKVSIGSDRTTRLIRYTIRSGSVVKTGIIQVQGTAVAVSTVPATPAPGGATTLRIKVTDATGSALNNVAVAASGVPGVTFPAATTDLLGEVVYNFAAPGTDGTYPITVEAGGVQRVYDLIVLTPGGGGIPDVVAPVAAISLIANPVVVGTNGVGSVNSQAEIRALFLTTANVPLPNMRVRFAIISSALPSESLSTGSTLVYSDTTGAAKTQYIAPTISSPTNGVVLRACYSGSDFAAGACPQFVTTTLTVAANPVALTIGTDNTIQKLGGIYRKTFDIQAVNSAGNYAADVPLSAVVDIEGYWKGPAIPAVPTLNTNDFGGYVWCPNEDVNRNNVLDTLPANEDVNGDGFLTPRKSDVSIGFVAGNRTSSTGIAQLHLNYTQDVATWLRVRITVTAGVTGSEGATTYRYILRAEEGDVTSGNGSFFNAIYGQDPDCTTAN
jgi:hypothetical protein